MPPPKSSKNVGAEALKKGTAQPIGNFFAVQRKAGRPKTAGNLTAIFQAADKRDKATAPAAGAPSAPARAARKPLLSGMALFDHAMRFALRRAVAGNPHLPSAHLDLVRLSLAIGALPRFYISQS